MSTDLCALCGRPAIGMATINGRRYCHSDYYIDPTCYMRAQWSGAHIPQTGQGDLNEPTSP